VKGLFYNGSTGVIVRILLLDSSSTTGGGKTGLTSASSGGIVSVIADNEATPTAYTVAAGNLETISTLGTYAAPTSGKCRFKEVDSTNHPGLYEIHLANARWAVSGAKSIIITVNGFSATVPANAEYQLSAVPATDASGAALPVASDWTTTRAGYLDAAISSRSTYAGGDTSGTTTLLSRLSATRAGYLDNLTNVDATISSRGTAADMTTLLSRLSSSRAGYLDYLNIGGLVASQADINALNQSASRRIILTALEQWERPESGSSTFTIEARTWDGDGAATNADSTPTLTATGGASGSLAASLSSATNTATGVYRWTFTVASSSTLEQVTLDISATIGGSAFTLTRFAVILDAVSATWTTGDRTKLTAIYDKLPTRQYLCGSTVNSGAIDLADRNAISDTVWDDATSDHTDANTFGALVQSLATSASLATASGNITLIVNKLPSRAFISGSTAATGSIVTADVGLASANLDTQLSALSTKVGTPAGASVSADIAAVKTDTGNLVTRIPSTLFSGITYLARWLGLIAGKTADSTTLTEMQATTAGAGYANTTDSLEAIRDRGDAAWSGGSGSSLTGANLVTITVTDGTDPVPGARVRVKAGALTEVKLTDASGVVEFSLDDNTWSIRITSPGLTFTSTTLAVTEDTDQTYEMTAATTSGDYYATGDDLVAYFDARTIGQSLLDTGSAVSAASVAAHPAIERFLRLASGAVNSALMASKRYTSDDLTGLTDQAAEHLKQITCDIAMYHISRRRIDTNPDRTESLRKVAESHLERLRKGEIILEVDEVKDAGVMDHATLTQSDLAAGVPQLRDRVGIFPARQKTP